MTLGGKMVRKLCSITALLLILCLALAGCNEDPMHTADTNPTNNTSGIRNTSGSAGTLAYADWRWAYNQNGAFSEYGYYYLKNGFLYFLDTGNGTSVCLCSKVGCLHDEEPDPFIRELCEARIYGLKTPVFYWDDHLYYIELDGYGPQLYRRNADGTAEEKIGTLGATYLKEQKQIEVWSHAVADGYLYYDACVESIVVDGDYITEVRDCYYVGRVDLKTGKDEVVLEGTGEIINLCAVRSNGFLFFSYPLPEIDPEDPAYQEALQQVPTLLKYWDGETEEVVTVFEKTRQECARINMVEKGKVYYSGTGVVTNWVYDLADGSDLLLTKDTLSYINGNYAFLHDGSGWHLWSIQTKEVYQIELASPLVVAETTSEDGFILAWRIQENGKIVRRIYCYATYASIQDGLQEEDMMQFYTLEMA